MIDVNSQRYKRMYAADMHAMAVLEVCSEAGCHLIEGPPGKWRWPHGQRSSADQHCKLFDSRNEAAEHFVLSREFDGWLRSRGVTR